uniref:Uncharacterized protein n=1 Tax=Anopheles epiroticus TaxID=199890 RepID=A0A182P015_9DIPT
MVKMPCPADLLEKTALWYEDGLHGYGMDASAAGMYDPHAGHRPPALSGLPPHHSPHLNHAAAAASVGMHGYHGTSSHVSPASSHMGAVQPDIHKRDKEAIYGRPNISSRSIAIVSGPLGCSFCTIGRTF